MYEQMITVELSVAQCEAVIDAAKQAFGSSIFESDDEWDKFIHRASPFEHAFACAASIIDSERAYQTR